MHDTSDTSYAIGIGCAPGELRPPELFSFVLKGSNLSESDFQDPARWFGAFLWELKPSGKTVEDFLKHRSRFENVLRRLLNDSTIRGAIIRPSTGSWLAGIVQESDRPGYGDVKIAAAEKGFKVKPDDLNLGYCRVWRRREILRTKQGAEMLTFEEAIELLNCWPDAVVPSRDADDQIAKLKNLAHKKRFNLVLYRLGGIQIEHYSGQKVRNPETGGVGFSFYEASEWLLRQQR